MALPFSINNADPADVDSPGLGAQEFRDLKQTLLDMFGIPNNTPISAAILSLGALVDGKIATAPILKGNNPSHRLIGTEGSALDVQLREQAGFLGFARNTGSEAAPAFSRVWMWDMNSATNRGQWAHANTATRTWTMPDQSGTVDVLPAGTVMLFRQAAAPTGWTRVVDAAHTDSVIIVRSNSEGVGFGGTWTTAHAHQLPINDNNAGFDRFGASYGVGTSMTGSDNLVLGGGTPVGFRLRSESVSVNGDSSWRPKFTDVILASKN